MTLSIDIETYSSNDIGFGVHKYVEAKDFEILLFAYSEDMGEVKIVDLAQGEKIPQNIVNKIFDPAVTKTAYNAQFEITCLSKHFGKSLDAKQWQCTMVLGAQAGLPFGLDNIAKTLKIIEQKDPKGKALIKYFSVPCKPTKVNKGRTRNLPEHDIDKWTQYKAYCVQDVVTERAVSDHLSWFTVSEFEKDVWALDQKINSTGVKIDLQLVKNAVKIDKQNTIDLREELIRLTGITNPKSNTQIKKYLLTQFGKSINSLDKESMVVLKKHYTTHPEIFKILDLKEKLSFTSIAKYSAMLKSVNSDSTIRGLFQYYGANRTGRWSGRNVQLQNLKRNDLDDLGLARDLVKANSLDGIRLCYGDSSKVLSNLIRTSFIPSKGKFFVISDFSAIEARIVAWFAGEQWRLNVFKTHGKIYEASASMMFKIPIESITKELRQKGKIAELALGYQGALGALQRMGGASMGLTDDDMLALVRKWRQANKKIVQLWYNVQEIVVEVIKYKKTKKFGLLTFSIINNNLAITLPSGRNLIYIKACLREENKIYYYGVDQLSKQWSLQTSYGGKFIENIVQATARDVLTEAMKRVDKAGLNIIMHVHDEIVVESSNADKDALVMDKLLSEPISWAPGLPLKSETFISEYYKK